MNLKEHIIEVNDEKLDDWNLLDWDNPNPYDYRYYKMLGLALFERVFGQNAFLATYNENIFGTFLVKNSYIIYGLHKNSILDFKLLLSLYDAYLFYFSFFINKDNIDSKFYKEYTGFDNEKELKYFFLNKSIYYTENDLPEILKDKKLVYGSSPNTYKDFLIGMYQMAHMMRWRSYYDLVFEYKYGLGVSSNKTTYTQAFNEAYDKAINTGHEYAQDSLYYRLNRSSVSRYEGRDYNYYFSAYIQVMRDITISSYKKFPYDSVVELYLGSIGGFDGTPLIVGTNKSHTDYDPSFLTTSIMLYDRKNVNKNEIVSFKIEDLQRKEYMIELPNYDKDDEFSTSKEYALSYLIIYDCNNSYKLKAN